MLMRFEVENYKNFKEKIVLDFSDSDGYKFNTECLYDNIISKLLLYGRNASGKTNLGNALMNISDIPNADSIENESSFKYCFKFDENIVEYFYKKDDNSDLTFESLIINDELVYNVDYKNYDNCIIELQLISAETLIVDRFFEMLDSEEITSENEIRTMQKPSFLRWIAANSAFKNDSIIVSLINFIDRMIFVTVGSSIMQIPRTFQKRYLESSFDKETIKDLESFFRTMGIDCKLILKQLPEGEKQIYFDHKNPVPFFGNASSGTLALFNLYRRIIMRAREASFIFLDEFDAFYHYDMAENLFKYFKKEYPKTQVIFTTHNTNLMTNRISRPDCMFILSSDGRLTSLSNATERELREGHNLEKLYISGEFERYE